MSDSVSIRLTKTQVSLIWPGLDIVIQGYDSRQKQKTPRFSCPFHLLPLPYGFDRGRYDEFMMQSVIALWRKLLPIRRKGGRVHMNAVEVRAAMFAVRTNYGYHRAGKRLAKRWGRETRERFGLSDDATKILRRRSKRTIRSLERHLKRANRHLLVVVPRDAYDAFMEVWQKHLRWMRYHLAYFKPLPQFTHARKTRQQHILNTLTAMAEKGLRNEGYQLPDSNELRRVMRLFARSARRFREGDWLDFALRNPMSFNAKSHLADFVLRRLILTKLGDA